MPSQGILHAPSLNVSPANTQRLGVVPALCEPGVVALHGTEAPRAWGGRMQEATGPVGLWQAGSGGVLGDSLAPYRQATSLHLQVAGGGTCSPPDHPADALDTYLRMT